MTSPKEILEKRGIYAEAIKAGWQEGASGWEIPVFNLEGQEIARRSKAYDSNAKFKYSWIPSKPDNPESDYYVLEGTLEAIKEAGGVCYLANGEASVLAMRAAGVYNAFATCHGESTVPKGILAQLERMGITKLINIADKDKAGTAAAAKWRDALRDSEHGYQAKQWPDYLAEKSDFNDLWMHHSFDREAVLIALDGCQALILPQPEVKTPKVITEKDKTPQGLINLIASHFGIQQWDSEGFSRKNVFCPFHDDKTKESAGFNQISGVLNCFACGAHSPKAVAEQLGIRWQDYYPKKERVKKPLKPDFSAITDGNAQSSIDADFITMGSASFSEIIPMNAYGLDVFNTVLKCAWIDQPELPASWVRALLHLCHSKSATPVYMIKLHRAIRCGKLRYDGFTEKEAVGLLDGSRPSVRNFLDFVTQLGFVNILDTKYLDTKDRVTQSLQNSKGGRPATIYVVNPNTDRHIDKLIELLEPVLLERLTEDELAPPAPSIRDSLDISFTEWKTWHERINNAKHVRTMDEINEMLCDVLENKASYSFTDFDLQSPAHLRSALLHIKLAPYSEDREYTDTQTGEIIKIPKGIQWSRNKLAFELGCSPSAMTKLYEIANVGHERKRGWYEVENPNDCDIIKELREAPLNLSKELSGVSLGVNIKYWDNGQEKWTNLAYADRAVNLFNKHNGHVIKLYIFVEQPSLLWNMNTEEIALEVIKEAELETQALDSAEDDSERTLVLEKIEKKAEKKARKPSFVSGKDRMVVGHSPEWKTKIVGDWVHCYTWHKLEIRHGHGLRMSEDSGGLIALKTAFQIVDNNGDITEICLALSDVIIWLNRNAETKQVRTIESRYMSDEIEVIIEVAQVATSQEITPKIEVEKEASSQAISVIAQAPKVAVTPTENFVGWCWANNPEEFNERMEAIGLKR